jgi:SOS-response transcriptional repressor LexA
MNLIQAQLLELSRRQDISSLGLREIARVLGVKNPQTIKYHMAKLQDAGLISPGVPLQRIDKSLLGKAANLITIPIYGSVSAGPATQSAEQKVQGYIKISSTLLESRNYNDLYALRVSGMSMNRANIRGKAAEDGDYAIVDGSKRAPRNHDYVIAVVDNLANIKRLHFDQANHQVVLLSESSEDFLPIFVHPDDEREGLISGTVVQVVKRPRS